MCITWIDRMAVDVSGDGDAVLTAALMEPSGDDALRPATAATNPQPASAPRRWVTMDCIKNNDTNPSTNPVKAQERITVRSTQKLKW